MNYAEDRIDRKTKADLQESLKSFHRILQDEIKDDKILFETHVSIAQNLRDIGQNIPALFHYGVAWEMRPNNAFCAGDYAQMSEFCGFPELGILALLFFRSGAQPRILFDAKDNKYDNLSCGCGFQKCGSFAGMIPFFNECSLNDARSKQIEELLVNQLDGFWNDDVDDGEVHENSDVDSKSMQRPFPPLIQLLLLKLLFSSMVGSGSVTLLTHVCDAIDHFGEKFKQSSRLNYQMLASGKKHKSHWAYYILIRAVVNGERMKPHRRQLVPYHVPVRDIIRNSDMRYVGICSNFLDRMEMKPLKQHSLELGLLVDNLLRATGKTKIPSPCLVSKNTNNKPLLIIGDSHILSISWQTLRLKTENDNEMYGFRTLLPILVTGLKAWHCRPETSFFTFTNLRLVLERISNLEQKITTIIISAGEIDCREGIGGKLLEGYYSTCESAVEQTVLAYINGLHSLSQAYQIQILVMPVAPHAYRSEKNGKATGRSIRRERMVQWNRLLRAHLSKIENETTGFVYFLDYWEYLSIDDVQHCYVLKKYYNADYTHMNSAFLPLLEESINQCRCDYSKL